MRDPQRLRMSAKISDRFRVEALDDDWSGVSRKQGGGALRAGQIAVEAGS